MSAISHSSSSPSTAVRPDALASLAALAAGLAEGGTLDEQLPRAARAVADVTAAAGCAIWLVDGTAPALAAAVGVPPCDVALVERVLGGARCDDGAAGLRVLPLLFGERAVGALAVSAQPALEPERESLLHSMAGILASTVGQALGRRELERELALRVRQLDDERRFTERIIDSLPVGLYVIDRDYRISVWNRKRETGLQGISREEAVGRTIFEILHRQPAEMLRQEFDDVFTTGEVQHFSMESNATGELRYYRISKIPMRDSSGDVTHVITLGEDVTESREAQERFAQAEKLAAIGQLAAGVMHEINNPLATIAACAESLSLALGDACRDGATIPGETGDYLRIVESEVQRCKRIVDRLLEFSRPRPLSPEPVDLNAVVEQTLFLLKHHTRFKMFAVNVDLAPSPPVTRGNMEQLVQVLMALLINSMDATGEQQGTIDVSTSTVAGPPEQAVLEVRDHGHGIPRSQLAKIFEPFYTTKAPGRGTGLGLSICYGIVAEHGGRIEAESTDGEGAVFRVQLPSGGAS